MCHLLTQRGALRGGQAEEQIQAGTRAVRAPAARLSHTNRQASVRRLLASTTQHNGRSEGLQAAERPASESGAL